jgi:hypothetical protein
MAIKYDVSDVEPGTDFDSPVPRGVYRCKVSDATEGQSQASIERGNPEDMLTMEYEITQGEYKGRKLWDYIVLNDSSQWKLAQLITALGRRAKGSLKVEEIVGDRVQVKVRHETDNRDPENPIVRARVGPVLPVAGDNGAEPDDDEEPEASADDDVDIAYDDLVEMDLDELKELIEEYELDVRVTKRSKVATVRDAVAEELELEPDEEPEDDDDEGEQADLTYEDLEGMDKAELISIIEDEELEDDITYTKRTKVDVLRQRLAEALELDTDEDEEDDDEEADYEDMTLKDLRVEAKALGLPTRGNKAALIKRLEKDDRDGGKPF